MKRCNENLGEANRRLRETHCVEKTRRGNVYRNKNSAKHAASRMTRRCGAPIDWFRCPICRHYHIGNRNNKEHRDAAE